MPALSVIVPCYNVEEYVPVLLATIDRNMREDIEFVLVEDCSDDLTRDLLRAGTSRVKNVELVELDVNCGLASARNAGMRAASGRYVTFLDADDWAARGHFAALLEAICGLGCSFVRTDHVIVHDRGRRVVRSPEPRRGAVFDPREGILPVDRPTGIDYPYAWAGVYDTEQIPPEVLMFDEGLHTAEDRPWIWRLYLDAPTHAVVPLAGIFYRRGVSTSLTQIGDRRQLDFIRAFDLAFEQVRNDPQADRFMHKAVRMYCAVMAHHLRNRRRFDATLQRRLVRECGRALNRLPDEVTDEVLQQMGGRRCRMLRLVRWSGDLRRW